MTTTKGAILSSDGRYRYTLWRELHHFHGCHALWILFNPSTADDVENDPTIRRVLGFSDREGYAVVTVINLFSLRATDPGAIALAEDPFGPEHDRIVAEEIATAELIVVGWGRLADPYPDAVDRMRRALAGRAPVCLGTNGNGSPCHPLYLHRNTLMVRWEP